MEEERRKGNIDRSIPDHQDKSGKTSSINKARPGVREGEVEGRKK